MKLIFIISILNHKYKDMKKLPFLVLLTLLAFDSCKNLPGSAKTTYYFCYSKPKGSSVDSAVKNILYTDILKISGNEQIIKERTSKWFKLVQNKCQSPNGCTSDLMAYNTAQEAEAMLNEMFATYNNPEEFKLEKVDFN